MFIHIKPHIIINPSFTETEIMKETPWSRIKGQNSGNGENGKLTGSVQKETTAVSVTILISVQNRHSRILLRDLPRSRL